MVVSDQDRLANLSIAFCSYLVYKDMFVHKIGKKWLGRCIWKYLWPVLFNAYSVSLLRVSDSFIVYGDTFCIETCYLLAFGFSMVEHGVKR